MEKRSRWLLMRREMMRDVLLTEEQNGGALEKHMDAFRASEEIPPRSDLRG